MSAKSDRMSKRRRNIYSVRVVEKCIANGLRRLMGMPVNFDTREQAYQLVLWSYQDYYRPMGVKIEACDDLKTLRMTFPDPLRFIKIDPVLVNASSDA